MKTFEYASEVNNIAMGIAVVVTKQTETLREIGDLLRKLAELNDKLLKDNN